MNRPPPPTNDIGALSLERISQTGDPEVFAVQIDGHDVMYLNEEHTHEPRASRVERARVLERLAAFSTSIRTDDAGRRVRAAAEKR